MGCQVGGVETGSCGGYGGGMGAAAFALVLFILLVIILKAGTGIY
ncbi:sporulation protein YjcZ [Cohnella sp. WQ 127256]|nr:sporulation protein YjcZ [Cohnella sp. WQ 127256]